MKGLAAEAAAEWLSQADARLAIEQAAAQLADISTRALVPQASPEASPDASTDAAPASGDDAGAGN